jgi:hypothetical protein
MHLQEENKFNNIYTIQKYGRGLDNQDNDMAALGKVRSPEGDLTFRGETNRRVTLQQG